MRTALVTCALLFSGCFLGHDSTPPVEPEPDLPEDYYELLDVDYSERTAEHVLISDLVELVGLLGHRVDAADRPPFDDGVDPGEVTALLETLFSADAATRAPEPIGLTTMPPTLQSTYGDLSDRVVLLDALPGASMSGVDPGPFDGPVDTPADLVRTIFSMLDAAAVARAVGAAPVHPVDPDEILHVHVTAEGVDLRALLESFLLGAVCFHRAITDYLADPRDERSWDQGFGAFGAAARYGEFDARALANGPRFRDLSSDERIDLSREYNFGAAVSAGERDYDSHRRARTDFVGDAWRGFRAGRQLISDASGVPDAIDLDALRVERDRVVGAWRATIAATLVSHINGAVGHPCVCGDPAFEYSASDFNDAAREWSAAKGHALALSLDPSSPLSAEQHATLHRLLGPAPVHHTGPASQPEVDAYTANLLEARALVGGAFGFEAQNLGDDEGDGGW